MRDSPRRRRRTALIALLALAPLAAAAVLAVVLTGSSGDSTAQASAGAQSAAGSSADGAPAAALPLHPVAGTFEPDDTKLEDCDEQRCYEQAFGNLAYYDGPEAALDVFDAKIAQPGPIESGCHRIVHTIGSASLARYGGNVARTFSEGRASCWSGYYHGVLERAFADVDAFDAVALGRVSRGLCDDAEVRKITWLAYQCVHGLGHGLMIHTGYDLPLALDTCDELATAWDQTSCKGGVFMENISTSYGVKSRWVKGKDDPVYPCNVIEQNDKLYCYLMVTSHILRVEDWDWEKTARICSEVENGWVATCFQSLGRDASGSSRQNPDEIMELCAVARPYGGEGDCISAAAKDMTANYAGGKEAAFLCDSTSAGLRGWCYYAIGTIMGSFTATEPERRADCEAITDDERYVAQCIRGASGLAPPAAAA
jgi:hypothetical protein